MATSKKPGIAPKKGRDVPKIKRVRPLSPGEFRDLVQGLKRERTHGEKALLWIGAKFIALGLYCYRLTD